MRDTWLVSGTVRDVYPFPMSHSVYLFARPSVLSGFARTFDIGGTFDSFNESATPRDADTRALAHDWMAVGDDLRAAAAAWAAEYGIEPASR